MDGIDTPRLIYLVVLLVALSGWLLAESRNNLGRSFRMLIAWGLIFLGLIAGYGLWEDVRREVVPRQAVLENGARIEVPRGPSGHYHLTLDLNGTPVNFLVDTGATDIVLTLQDARRVGLDPDGMAFLGSARTANGSVRTAFATIDRVTLGPVGFDGVRVAVNEGEMQESLLGMSFLNRFARLEIASDRLVLEP